MKIFRLAKAKIKKNKKESILLCILLTICMILLSSFASSLVTFNKITPMVMEQTECCKNQVFVDQKIFSNDFLRVLEEDDRVERYTFMKLEIIDMYKLRVGDGEEKERVSLYVTSVGGEERFEKFEPHTSYSKEELSAVEHPIYLDGLEAKRYEVNEGDTLTIIHKDREFTYTFVGTFNSGMDSTNSIAVVNDEDMDVLEQYFDTYEVIGIDLVEGEDNKEFLKEYKDHCNELSVEDITGSFNIYDYETFLENSSTNMSLISAIVGIMAGITVISIMVMIRLRIVGDINDQIVSIGVLEALGYRTKEIAKSYVIEYSILATLGVVLGTLPGVAFTKFLVQQTAGGVLGFAGNTPIEILPIVFSGIGIILFVRLISRKKAMAVKKYPPVLAFRKGIETHSFKRSFFPLEKTRGNIHIRLAMKRYVENLKSDFGLVVCISAITVTIVISYIFTAFFSNPDKILDSVAGHELCDIRLETVGSIEAEDFKKEIESMPEVDKVLRTSTGEMMTFDNTETNIMLDIYDDFSETTNMHLKEGRLPEHENEIAFTVEAKAFAHVSMGETVTMKYGNVTRDYVVTGFVNSLINANTAYLTEDGFRLVNPAYAADVFDIYLRDDVDIDEFAKLLKERYGSEITDIVNAEITGDTYEEKIRSAAEIKMAEEMVEHGVSYMEYTIQIDDTVIRGSTNTMKINTLSMIRQEYRYMLDMLFNILILISAALMIVAAVVVVLMLSILMESTIRKQYRDLGIMKGLGYTSKELMLQMAFRIVPTTIVAVFFGLIMSGFVMALTNQFLAEISFSVIGVVIVVIAIILFCFFCSYISAKKIKKISVYELMTE